jgi:two-component system chemotaxis response regulator CheB
LGPSGKTRVLVVDDSALMRRVICNLLEEDPDLHVVGTAVDGYDAIHKIGELSPDVVTLDLEMPRLDGLQTLGYLMSERPIPCIMLSAYTVSGAEATLKALEYGAADFVQKPSGAISLNLDRVREELIEKVKIARYIDLKRLPFRDGVTPLLKAPEGPPAAAAAPKAAGGAGGAGVLKCVVAIGCSTGGPRALAELVPGLPKGLKAPVLIVQHMSAGFTKSLAERLDKDSEIHVKEAEEGEILQPGTCYLAPGDWHMEVERKGFGGLIRLNQRPPSLGVRPSVDHLFLSVAEAFGDKAVGVLLTGMGRDGTKGMKAMKLTQARTLAQDEASSVVYGMPRSAFNAGVVDKVVALKDMASAVAESVG